ncbi:MAG: GT4 family glycosyltransferase PelF [Acidobacteria bacterium]|nr:GT4 family glycosyltransferase PelF [Acidobacteriota bacterium]
MNARPAADVCLILEGTYPYVTGGVSNWTHDLIRAQSHLSFHLVALVPPGPEVRLRFELPTNVTGVTRIELQSLAEGCAAPRGFGRVLDELEEPLIGLTTGGGLAEVEAVLKALRSAGPDIGREALLNSREAWTLLMRMYERQCPRVSFLDYFWTWRTLLLGVSSVLLAPLAPARVYHALCTGYAGLYATRARLETGCPALLTEHGIYTNERRVEITMADWLQQDPLQTLSIDHLHRDLRDLWIDTFTSFSRATYAACSQVITLFEGNTELQLQDGAAPEKLRVIPNGIELGETVTRLRGSTAPTVALVGRVVPIKDIKTFLRAAAILRDFVPDVRVWVLGPLDEDPDYVAECRQLATRLDLEATVEFKGRVALTDYYPLIDVLVLTSVSEAQPLVILEAAAMGVPSVATDVGSCREMILGRSDEQPPLGMAGAVTPLANPAATAEAVRGLLTDACAYQRCSAAAQERVRRCYNKANLDRAYRDIYQEHLETTVALVEA